jgi:hypothetical protein
VNCGVYIPDGRYWLDNNGNWGHAREYPRSRGNIQDNCYR